VERGGKNSIQAKSLSTILGKKKVFDKKNKGLVGFGQGGKKKPEKKERKLTHNNPPKLSPAGGGVGGGKKSVHPSRGGSQKKDIEKRKRATPEQTAQRNSRETKHAPLVKEGGQLQGENVVGKNWAVSIP